MRAAISNALQVRTATLPGLSSSSIHTRTDSETINETSRRFPPVHYKPPGSHAKSVVIGQLACFLLLPSHCSRYRRIIGANAGRLCFREASCTGAAAKSTNLHW